MKNNRKAKTKTEQKFDPNTLLLSANTSFAVQEAYKTLRTNVAFSLPGKDSKCIGVTSANRGEGKSTIAANLAISLAQLNKRVVLIDCDMRLPTVATKMRLKATEGLSNFLSGGIDEIPVYYLERQGIDVIPSGNIPPDSTILINSDAMTDMLRTLKEEYDFIVLDFPPINIVSDAVLLTEHIDGYLMVIRHGYSETKKVHEALRQMRLANAKIIGCVYNGKSTDKKYYKKRNYYYYKGDYSYYNKPESR